MTTPVSKKNFCVAIIGGGLCGLACAVALDKRGMDAHVFEAAAVRFAVIRARAALIFMFAHGQV